MTKSIKIYVVRCKDCYTSVKSYEDVPFVTFPYNDGLLKIPLECIEVDESEVPNE